MRRLVPALGFLSLVSIGLVAWAGTELSAPSVTDGRLMLAGLHAPIQSKR